MEFIQHDWNWAWATLAAVSGTLLLVTSMRGGGRGVSPAQATQLINREDALVIDVREQAEWDGGHIGGARHIPFGQIAQRLGELEKFKARPLIIACASGHRSSSTCATLRKAGFEKVFALDGGTGAWEQAGLPLTKK